MNSYKTVILLSIGLVSCTPTKISTTKTLYVKVVSPGDNGLSTYYIKSKGMRGGLKLIDSNNKYKPEDKFILKEVITLY